MTLYRRQGSEPSPRKRNVKRQNGFLRRPTYSCEKKRRENQRRKGKIFSFEFRVPKVARRDKKVFLRNQC